MNTRLHHHPTSYGDVLLQGHYSDDGQCTSVEIVTADPRVLIDGKMLRRIHSGEDELTVPFAEIDHVAVGGVFRIHAANRILVYRLTEYEPPFEPGGPRIPDTYVGEWPD